MKFIIEKQLKKALKTFSRGKCCNWSVVKVLGDYAYENMRDYDGECLYKDSFEVVIECDTTLEKESLNYNRVVSDYLLDITIEMPSEIPFGVFIKLDEIIKKALKDVKNEKSIRN